MRNSASILVSLLGLLTGCPKDQNPPPKPDGKVCCESFGYGSMMVKCCESYAWTAPDACVVPPDHVGGGMQVVAPELCANVAP